MKGFTYIGTELELFDKAHNWKNYIKLLLNKYIKGNVLEVGAGMGKNTRLLCRYNYNNWLCLEPDPALFQSLEYLLQSNFMTNCLACNGTIDSLNDDQLFDSILYLDVLEHIREDKKELIKAFHHLKIGGNLIILSPAHQCLFTAFDTAIGHYRRYNKSTLKAILPKQLEIIKLLYIDCVGLLASLANKLLLKQNQPTLSQIKIWDNLMVPLSIKIDPILGYNWGKSVFLLARKIA